ncbi:MAG: hypothetical protein JNJ83_08270 [Verrucomicrobiaceae bacterium]|nr:hypothetical protein [Verrucomicrobiaceae bacterium]
MHQHCLAESWTAAACCRLCKAALLPVTSLRPATTTRYRKGEALVLRWMSTGLPASKAGSDERQQAAAVRVASPLR